jgi:hypothetical protein
MFTNIIISFFTALFTAFAAFFIQKDKLKTELRTEFMAEQAAKSLLENPRWKKRNFDEIKKRLGGFSDDELRKILVRAGAVRFERKEDNGEMWGLMAKNESDL